MAVAVSFFVFMLVFAIGVAITVSQILSSVQLPV